MLEGAWAGQNPFFYQCVQTKKKNKNLKKKMQKKSPAKQILGGQNPPFLFFSWPLNEKLGFCLPAQKCILRFHYRQIFTRTPGKKNLLAGTAP